MATEEDTGQVFAVTALQLRKEAQERYARAALERLHAIAMHENGGAVQVSALKELLEQVLGRPMTASPPGERDEDWFATVERCGRELRHKLDRMADGQESAGAAQPERSGAGPSGV